MRLLLDTHALLWYLQGDARISKRVEEEIGLRGAAISLVSVWEIAIKAGKGTLPLFVPLAEIVRVAVEVNGFTLLSVELPHVLAVQHLPPHHGDPFDRLLIAQARIEGLALASRDEAFDAYDVERVW